MRQIDFISDPNIQSVVAGPGRQGWHEVEVIMRQLHPVRPEYLHRNLIDSVEYVSCFILIEFLDIQIDWSGDSHKAVVDSVEYRVMQTFVPGTGVDGKAKVVTNLHEDEPRDIHFTTVNFVPDKGCIFSVEMLDLLHCSPGNSHITAINFIPNPRVQLYVIWS